MKSFKKMFILLWDYYYNWCIKVNFDMLDLDSEIDYSVRCSIENCLRKGFAGLLLKRHLS